ncbi:acetyl-CoA synthetase-like protein [Favolaschia claudopus]|uniref:Acetyl-CoA synthetase-like protein n=1 Tax=Favolaschia claudopus TaxID=2862362 RepID=A0AAW0AFT5_9AGAR
MTDFPVAWYKSVLPPLDCSLNLSQIINVHLIHQNHTTAYSFTDANGHTTNISHFEFARAAHRVAHILRPQRQGGEGQTLAIVALTDVLIYHTLTMGCIIAGVVPFLISHRNSTAAILHLLNDTNTHRLLTTHKSLGHLADELSRDSAYELSFEEVPLLGQLYPHLGRETAEANFAPYPDPVTPIPVDNVALYLHSSGSTGFPKSIPETHRALIHHAVLEGVSELAQLAPRLAAGQLPPFHTLGIMTQVLHPLLNGATSCLYPLASTETEYRIPVGVTSENALLNAQRAKVNGIMTVPSLILEWQSAEAVAYLKTLNLLTYAGGPLATRVGTFLFDQGVNIVPVYGATEFGAPTVIKRRQAEIDAREWDWIRFSRHSRIRWVPQGEGTFEAQFLTVRETHQLSVENLPDVKGYATKDIFERHPTKPDLYRIVGRLDDVLVLANGEKAVPGPMEDIMMASPFIIGAVMFGRERNQVGVLIQPHPNHAVDPSDEKQIAKFRNLVWPVVEAANEISPAFARIYKEMITVTHPSKPTIRAPKGTLMKKSTIALYREEIDKLYDTVESSADAANDIEPPSSWASSDLFPWLKKHASLVADREISGGRDIFDQGFDSLNATFMRHRIVGALRNSGDPELVVAAQKIPQNFVYAHPSIEELADAISALVQGNADDSSNFAAAKANIERMIAKYSDGLDKVTLKTPEKRVCSSATVLLTGSTGGLGSHILESLLASPTVERVYAFNRKGRTPLSMRQTSAFVDRSLDVALLSSEKLVYLEGDAAKQDLGLPPDVFKTVRDTITAIIHNAWALDFNKTLSSFEPHLKGTRNLIDVACQSPNVVRFLFTSSIASAQNWDVKRGPFPEELQLDATVAVGNGYGESKYVSERILAASGLPATSFRIGQVCGSATTGTWSTSDWLPALVKSSIALGNFPSDTTATINWIPPEAVSQAIIDATLSAQPAPFAMNLVHPRPVSWDSIMSAMAGSFRLPLIPMKEWVDQLEDRAGDALGEEVDRIPAIKLLDFFKAAVAGTGTGLNVVFSTDKAQALSETMKELNPICEEDTLRWIRYWKKDSFIAA